MKDPVFFDFDQWDLQNRYTSGVEYFSNPTPLITLVAIAGFRPTVVLILNDFANTGRNTEFLCNPIFHFTILS